MKMEAKLISFQERFGYVFRRPELLRLALTHRSKAHEKHHDAFAPKSQSAHLKALPDEHNERLEFLGDAVLCLAATSLLWDMFPNASEGELTRKRAAMISEKSLTLIAQSIELGQALYLGKGEDKTGGRKKPRLLASSLEALFGAVLLDADVMKSVQHCQSLLRPFVRNHVRELRDHKSQLQEVAQAMWGQTPTYRLDKTEGPAHAKIFHVSVMLGNETLAQGVGTSKATAEQIAAQAALEKGAT